MKAPNVEGNVERAGQRFHASHVAHEKLGPYIVMRDPLLRFGNRDWREVDSGRVHPLLRHIA
jgi:hypothetical protein